MEEVAVGALRTLSGVVLVTRYVLATVATGPLMMSLSTVSDTPPQVSTWSPRYCLARCHSAHRVLPAVGQPVSVATVVPPRHPHGVRSGQRGGEGFRQVAKP